MRRPYYYRARDYDPTAARSTNEDPTRFAGGANFYEYTVNDPAHATWVHDLLGILKYQYQPK